LFPISTFDTGFIDVGHHCDKLVLHRRKTESGCESPGLGEESKKIFIVCIASEDCKGLIAVEIGKHDTERLGVDIRQ
jgi:hypothetical protein